MNFVLDTNIALYWFKDLLADVLPEGQIFVSVVTEMELLSFPFAGESEEPGVRSFLQNVRIIPLTEEVKRQAITLRRTRKLKLPDAIIAGTALALNAKLLSNDEGLQRAIGEQCERLRLKA